MAASVDSASPSLLTKEDATSLMMSSPLFSPASDKRFWSSLRTRVDSLLDTSHPRASILIPNLQPADAGVGESDGAKRMKEDSLLLLRGFDSIAHTLSQLSNNLDNALLGARHLAEPPTLTEIFHTNLMNPEVEQQDLEHQRNEEEKREEEEEDEKKKGLKRKLDPSHSSEDHQANDSHKENDLIPKDKKLKRAKNIAISMATKAASLARELKSLKSDLCFMQDRCGLLEEENRRLRDGFHKGIRPEEDDLMRLQMEALLAEKSRLANENANLVRENQCLHQLVEYHQHTSQDLSASYEEVIRGMCLDFSSPLEEEEEEEEGYEDDNHVAETPRPSLFGISTSLDRCFRQEQKGEEETLE